MSILKRLLEQKKNPDALFCCVYGYSTAGKSTLAGTLPGKTLIIQIKNLETGSKSALQVAKQLGNNVSIVDIESDKELISLFKEIKETDHGFDNIYVDSLSAFTEMFIRQPEIKLLAGKDRWAAFNRLADAIFNIIIEAKKLSNSSETKKPCRMFMTLAVENDKEGKLVPSIVGTASIKHIFRKFPSILYLHQHVDEENTKVRYLYAQSNTINLPTRLDSVLDTGKELIFHANLKDVIDYTEKGSK